MSIGYCKECGQDVGMNRNDMLVLHFKKRKDGSLQFCCGSNKRASAKPKVEAK